MKLSGMMLVIIPTSLCIIFFVCLFIIKKEKKRKELFRKPNTKPSLRIRLPFVIQMKISLVRI